MLKVLVLKKIMCYITPPSLLPNENFSSFNSTPHENSHIEVMKNIKQTIIITSVIFPFQPGLSFKLADHDTHLSITYFIYYLKKDRNTQTPTLYAREIKILDDSYWGQVS